MKKYSLKTTPFSPISHNPSLKKQVIFGDDVIKAMKHLSHIVLPVGATAVEHTHADSSEVFYCVRGEVEFTVGQSAHTLTEGDCLVVEPGETHSIKSTPEETELLYFMGEAER